jgi:hypothetical protein
VWAQRLDRFSISGSLAMLAAIRRAYCCFFFGAGTVVGLTVAQGSFDI